MNHFDISIIVRRARKSIARMKRYGPRLSPHSTAIAPKSRTC